jgi:hypothetical protein
VRSLSGLVSASPCSCARATIEAASSSYANRGFARPGLACCAWIHNIQWHRTLCHPAELTPGVSGRKHRYWTVPARLVVEVATQR